MIKYLITPLLVCILITATHLTIAEDEQLQNQGIILTPELLELLRAEMREVTNGIQNVIPALATADWAAIAGISDKIRASYIMEKSLTPAQVEELERSLPEPFKQLDAEFHQRAAKLAAAAAAHDAELVVFHYSRLLDSCTRCHSAYVSTRFPGFNHSAPAQHSH